MSNKSLKLSVQLRKRIKLKERQRKLSKMLKKQNLPLRLRLLPPRKLMNKLKNLSKRE